MANEFKVRKGLEVTGPTVLTGATTVTGNAAISGDLSVSGNVTGGLDVSGDLNVTQNANITQNLDVNGTADIAGNTTIQGDLTVNGSFSFLGGSVFPDNTFEVQDNVDVTKAVNLSVGGSTTGTKSTLNFSQTANRAISVPDASTTLVGTDVQQSLSNKKLLTSTVSFADNTDPTKTVAINAAAITTATQRSIAMPDADVDLGSLVNSNISASAAIARSKIASGTASHAVINDGSGVLSSEAQLAPVRGGIGVDMSASTGVVKMAAGTGSVSAVVDADIDAAAAIARSKVAAGTAAHVLINDGSGNLSSEASLLETRGGTAQTTYAPGDILYASASNTLAKLPIGVPGQMLKPSESGVPAWEDSENASRELRLYDDFMGGLTGDRLNWSSWAGGAGSQASNVLAAVTAGHPGVLSFTSGTTSTGRMGLGLSPSAAPNANGLIIAADTFIDEYLIEVVALSTGAEEYVLSCGLHRQATSLQQTDGVILKYDRATYGTNWQCETSSASTTTRTDSGVAVSTGWVKLRMESNTTECKFYINGTLVATHTTNIPAIAVGPGHKLDKTVGTGAGIYRIDYYKGFRRFSSAR